VKLIPQDSVIKFPGNLGIVKTVFHKELPDAKFTTVTISKNADGRYYASILFNQADNPVVAIRDAIGVDLGLKNFAITSEGSKYDLPKNKIANLEKNRKRKLHKLAKKTDKTSNKHRKAKRLVAKVSSKIARVREDFLHKLSRIPGIRKPSYLCRRYVREEYG
jgi:putative transposase